MKYESGEGPHASYMCRKVALHEDEIIHRFVVGPGSDVSFSEAARGVCTSAYTDVS